VARDAIQGLINFLQGFADFFIRFFLRDLWVILLVLLPFYALFLIARAIFRKVRKPKAEAVQTEETK
jgi:flagellar biosynthesis/type III secretory pathway M-ring protein FliF/YscJ